MAIGTNRLGAENPMRPTIPEYQVGAGCLLAILCAVLRVGMPSHETPALLEALEPLSFGLCCVGVMGAGRSVRVKYEALGRNKDLARRDPAYMRQRLRMQCTAVIASASLWSLAAGRFGIPPLTAVALLIGLAILLPVINRATGWRRSGAC